MLTFIKSFVRDEFGSTAMEYAIIGALIGVGVLASVVSLGNSASETYGEIDTELAAAIN